MMHQMKWSLILFCYLKKIQKSDSGVKTWKIKGVTVEQSAYPDSWHCQIKKAHEYFCDLPIPSCVSLYPNMGTHA